jgi:hypothetical protein
MCGIIGILRKKWTDLKRPDGRTLAKKEIRVRTYARNAVAPNLDLQYNYGGARDRRPRGSIRGQQRNVTGRWTSETG